MDFIYNDGGRAAAGFKGSANDCVVRAITIATEQPYRTIYDAINETAKRERIKQGQKRSSAREGVNRATIDYYMKLIGWTWIPTMFIGSGCKVHLDENELPDGRLVVRISKHITAVINGVIHDTYDPDRNQFIIENGIERRLKRCVYGYYIESL